MCFNYARSFFLNKFLKYLSTLFRSIALKLSFDIRYFTIKSLRLYVHECHLFHRPFTKLSEIYKIYKLIYKLWTVKNSVLGWTNFWCCNNCNDMMRQFRSNIRSYFSIEFQTLELNFFLLKLLSDWRIFWATNVLANFNTNFFLLKGRKRFRFLWLKSENQDFALLLLLHYLTLLQDFTFLLLF